jgi:hypothetical protein
MEVAMDEASPLRGRRVTRTCLEDGVRGNACMENSISIARQPWLPDASITFVDGGGPAFEDSAATGCFLAACKEAKTTALVGIGRRS